MGDSNILNKLPISSSIFIQKIFIILYLICMIKKKEVNINLDDEIIEKTIIR